MQYVRETVQDHRHEIPVAIPLTLRGLTRKISQKDERTAYTRSTRPQHGAKVIREDKYNVNHRTQTGSYTSNT